MKREHFLNTQRKLEWEYIICLLVNISFRVLKLPDVQIGKTLLRLVPVRKPHTLNNTGTKINKVPSAFQITAYYRWASIETRSEICQADRQANYIPKIKHKFRTSTYKKFALCTVYWYSRRVRNSRLLVFSLWQCLSHGGIRTALS
jgi:hypothetical protein